MPKREPSNNALPPFRVWVVLLIALFVGYVLPGLIVVNTSPSTKYRVFFKKCLHTTSLIKVNDYVLFKERLPAIDAKRDVVLTKMVGCSGGQILKGDGNRDFFCDGSYLGHAKLTTLKGEPLDFFRYDGAVPAGKLFVIGQHKDSYDSRYYGFVDESRVIAKLQPIF